MKRYLLLIFFLSHISYSQLLIKVSRTFVKAIDRDTSVTTYFYPSVFQVQSCGCPHELTEKNFQVFEDSIAIDSIHIDWICPSYVEPELTYCFVIDASLWNDSTARKIVYQFVDAIRDSIDEGILIVSQDDKYIVMNMFDSSRSAIRKNLDFLQPAPEGKTWDAVKYCIDTLLNSNRDPDFCNIFVLTDGKSQNDYLSLTDLISYTSGFRAPIYPVSVNLQSNDLIADSLKMLADNTRGLFKIRPTNKEIEEQKCIMRTRIWGCFADNSLEYRLRTPCNGKEHTIKIIVRDCNIENTFYSHNKCGSATTVSEQIPNQFELYQNYPNPFSESTNIRFRISVEDSLRRDDRLQQSEISSRKSVISFKVYDLLGREVLDLSDEANQKSEIVIRNSQLPHPGIYFYRLTVDGRSLTKMMSFLR